MTSIPTNCISFSPSRDFQGILELKDLLESKEGKVKWDLLDPKERL